MVGIYGSVEDQHGKGLRDAKVTVFLPSGTSEIIRVSKNSGQFKYMLAEGTHRIVASMDGYEKYKGTVHVAPGSMTKVKIVLDSGHGIGQVVDLNAATLSHTNRNVNDYDYFYYPRKKMLEIKDKHSRHFDLYK